LGKREAGSKLLFGEPAALMNRESSYLRYYRESTAKTNKANFEKGKKETTKRGGAGNSL
jgi:hypothetical protein